MKSGWLPVRAVILLFALLCAGQQPSVPQQESQVTTLHAATRLILLDVVVTDKRGKPVRNLSKNDFTIQEDGDNQAIASFEAPSGHAPVTLGENLRSAGGGASAAQPANAMVSSALTILVLDELNTLVLDQAYARREIRRYLRAHGPRLPEPTALMALEEKRLELLHDYSSDANALEAALQKHPAHLPFRLMTAGGITGSSERLGDALEALREIAGANDQFAGRKNVIWIGAGFPSLNYLSAQPADRERLFGYMRETAALLWKSRLSLYTLDPRGLEVVHENFDGLMDPLTDELVFEQLAPQTGGRIFRELNDLDAQIASSVEDGDSYYSISYYPSHREWNGSFRKIRVVIRSPELTARTRNGYYATPESIPTDQEMDLMLSRAVINPLSYHSLQVQARASFSGTSQRTAHITVNIDANQLHWETRQTGKHRCEITTVTAGFSHDGKVAGHAVKELEVAVDEKKYAELRKRGMVMNLIMELPPSAVRMRVVARDSTNGNMGTADLTLTGEQFH
jgi:VWFA-related protein